MGDFWNDPAIILYTLIGILILDNLWSFYLQYREIRVVRKVYQVPEVLRPFLPQSLFLAMRAYRLHMAWFTIVNTLIIVVIAGCLELYFGFFAFLWDISGHIAHYKWMKNEIVMSIIFLILFSVYTTLKSWPGKLYVKCCIPKLINRPSPTWLTHILTELLDIVLSLFLICVSAVGLVCLFSWLDKYAFLALFAICVVLTLMLMLAVPFFIDPFIGNRVPLQNLQLKAELEELTARVGFPMRQVHVIRVRDPSTGSNAFFYGCCCLKRIVIFDTLLWNRGLPSTYRLPPEEENKGLRDSQVVAVVAHELGHWWHGHFYKAMIIFKMHLLLTLALFGICYPHGPIYQAVGFEEGLQPIIAGMMVIFGYVLTPYFTLCNVSMLYVTRQFEYQADKFAFNLGYAVNLKIALLKLYADNLSYPISDECYSMWHHTHPTMLHRLARLDQLQASRNRT